MLAKNLRSIITQLNGGGRSISTRSRHRNVSPSLIDRLERRTLVLFASITTGIVACTAWELAKLGEYAIQEQKTMDRRPFFSRSEPMSNVEAASCLMRNLFKGFGEQ